MSTATWPWYLMNSVSKLNNPCGDDAEPLITVMGQPLLAVLDLSYNIGLHGHKVIYTGLKPVLTSEGNLRGGLIMRLIMSIPT